MLLTRNLWTLIATVLLAGVLPAQPRALEPISVQRRLAFVLGNHAYPGDTLKNPLNDARALAKTLENLGFEEPEREDLGKRDFETQFNAFARKAGSNDLALFYFEGHGLQVQNEIILLPVDFLQIL